eukprot:tig00020684_g12902.t1
MRRSVSVAGIPSDHSTATAERAPVGVRQRSGSVAPTSRSLGTARPSSRGLGDDAIVYGFIDSIVSRERGAECAALLEKGRTGAFSLCFADADLEVAFRREYARQGLARARVCGALFLLICFYQALAVGLEQRDADQRSRLAFVAFLGGAGACVVALGFLGSAWARRSARLAHTPLATLLCLILAIAASIARTFTQRYDVATVAPTALVALVVISRVLWRWGAAGGLATLAVTYGASVGHLHSAAAPVAFAFPLLETAILMAVVGRALEATSRRNFLLARLTRETQAAASQEKERSDEILRNVLPESVIEAWREEREHTINRRFESAAIVFVNLAEPPTVRAQNTRSIMPRINAYLAAMEDLAERHGLLKIKTIGFAFMAACGLPEERPAAECAEAAAGFAADALAAAARFGFPLKVGAHVGPVVAGIIGCRVFYDVFGDAVNTSQRMCANCPQGAALVSGDLGSILKASGREAGGEVPWELSEPAPLKVKGKGLMQTHVLRLARPPEPDPQQQQQPGGRHRPASLVLPHTPAPAPLSEEAPAGQRTARAARRPASDGATAAAAAAAERGERRRSALRFSDGEEADAPTPAALSPAPPRPRPESRRPPRPQPSTPTPCRRPRRCRSAPAALRPQVRLGLLPPAGAGAGGALLAPPLPLRALAGGDPEDPPLPARPKPRSGALPRSESMFQRLSGQVAKYLAHGGDAITEDEAEEDEEDGAGSGSGGGSANGGSLRRALPLAARRKRRPPRPLSGGLGTFPWPGGGRRAPAAAAAAPGAGGGRAKLSLQARLMNMSRKFLPRNGSFGSFRAAPAAAVAPLPPGDAPERERERRRAGVPLLRGAPGAAPIDATLELAAVLRGEHVHALAAPPTARHRGSVAAVPHAHAPPTTRRGSGGGLATSRRRSSAGGGPATSRRGSDTAGSPKPGSPTAGSPGGSLRGGGALPPRLSAALLASSPKRDGSVRSGSGFTALAAAVAPEALPGETPQGLLGALLPPPSAGRHAPGSPLARAAPGSLAGRGGHGSPLNRGGPGTPLASPRASVEAPPSPLAYFASRSNSPLNVPTPEPPLNASPAPAARRGSGGTETGRFSVGSSVGTSVASTFFAGRAPGAPSVWRQLLRRLGVPRLEALSSLFLCTFAEPAAELEYWRRTRAYGAPHLRACVALMLLHTLLWPLADLALGADPAGFLPRLAWRYGLQGTALALVLAWSLFLGASFERRARAAVNGLALVLAAHACYLRVGLAPASAAFFGGADVLVDLFFLHTLPGPALPWTDCLPWDAAFLAIPLIAWGVTRVPAGPILWDIAMIVATCGLASWFRELESRTEFVLNRDLQRETATLAEECAGTEHLLDLCLPPPVAEKLKSSPEAAPGANRAPVAEYYESVAVLCADIVGFTPLSASLDPAELVAMLNELYSELDELAYERGVQHLKTIGDAWLAVVGLEGPPTPDAVVQLVDLAAASVRAFHEYAGRTGRAVSVRVGVAMGHAAGAVLGKRRWMWDLFGEGMDLAFALEASSLPGRIHLSREVAEAVRGRVPLEPRWGPGAATSPGAAPPASSEAEGAGRGPPESYLVALPAVPPSPDTSAEGEGRASPKPPGSGAASPRSAAVFL